MVQLHDKSLMSSVLTAVLPVCVDMKRDQLFWLQRELPTMNQLKESVNRSRWKNDKEIVTNRRKGG